MRKILLSGTSKGIGREILKLAVKAGYRCVVLNRKFINDKLHKNCIQHSIDLSDLTVLEKLCDLLKSQVFYAIVNNAGFGRPFSLERLSLKQVNYELNLNLIAPIMLIKSILPNMKLNGGRIINISSIAGKQGAPFLYTYSAAKAGLIALTHSISQSVVHHGITVNSICPGGVDTEMSKNGRKEISEFLDMPDDYYEEQMIKKIGFGKLIHPSAVANLVIFLLSSQADSITGQSFNVCGNLLMQ